MLIRLARLDERAALEELQRRASLHEPMYRAQLTAHPDAIELPAAQISAGQVRVAEQDGMIVGFSVVVQGEAAADSRELDGLFVEPARWRTGIGRRLIEDAVATAREGGALCIEVVANPQAVAFYEGVGFVGVGETQTRFGPAPRMSLVIGGVDRSS